MQDTEGYKVELSGPGLNLQRELSEPTAHELLVWLLKGGKLQSGAHGGSSAAHVASADATIPGSGNSSPGALMSVREFMEQFEPRRVPDKIACFALYLREHRNQKEFSKADLVSLFQEAAEPLPKNLGRDLRWTQSIAWIAPAPSNRDSFYLTKKGEDAVRNRFPKEMVARTRLTTAPQRRRHNDPAKAEPPAKESDQTPS
ncbi:MAG: hypothetical protein H0U23_06870 [Blastocatellia bacterium]|nr:hypothetical protein [Blastocatellia bacterium]